MKHLLLLACCCYALSINDAPIPLYQRDADTWKDVGSLSRNATNDLIGDWTLLPPHDYEIQLSLGKDHTVLTSTRVSGSIETLSQEIAIATDSLGEITSFSLSMSKPQRKIGKTKTIRHVSFTPITPVKLPERAKMTFSQDGKLVEPPPEKTFLQKYWMHILGAVIVLLASGSDSKGAAERPASS